MSTIPKNAFPLAHPLIFLPIVIGSMIYLLWRQEDILFNQAVSQISLWDYVSIVRSRLPMPTSWVEEFVVYSLPMAFWCFSWSLAHAMQTRSKRNQWIFGLVILTLSVSSEVLQISIIPGTFDWNDLLAIAIGSGAYFLFIHHHKVPCIS